MSEAGQRSRVIKALKSLDAFRADPPGVPAGTPDVNYIEGWIELKWLRFWPARETTVVRIEHFTDQQRRWLKRRWELGGNAWLLLQIGREWLLFHGLDAHDYVGNLTRNGLYRCARMRWTKGLQNEELVACLKRDWEDWDGCPVVSGC